MRGGQTSGVSQVCCPLLFALLKGRRGAAAIELALTLPFMMVVLMGIFDFGNITYTMMEVNAAAHAGVMYAYANRSACTTSGIETAENTATSLGSPAAYTGPSATGAAGLGHSAPSCTVSGCSSSAGIVATSSSTCTTGDPTPGTYAVAFAQYNFTPLLPWTGLVFPSTISATAVMRYN